ncbi:carbohydrate ABC transporter permease [Heyndrickxia ginsengihumi]|uniref:Sugar ABC transporter permease n=1 Tax=Heyndrickxia ginsengihumi TaxID=363870 RepID=A0A6M0P5W5_9BACI|nr:sugar ABC transporter permease [Bacillus sp. (in: firmicutes)]NEY19290.1 sugar ABC transporter permease [Heyndrickxia ginsengihumi]
MKQISASQQNNHYGGKWNVTPWLFAGPHLIIFLIFFLIPVVYGIYISFTDWDLIGKPDFVGLENYKEILFQKSSTFYDQLHNGLKNTFIFVIITVPFCIIVPLLLASALNAKPKLSKIFQSLFYLPSLFAISAVMITWSIMFNVSYGPINHLFGLGVNWVGNQPYAWITLVIVTVWWCIGGNMIIYQAALNGISKDFYEAANIDGANSIQKFFNITLPSIRPQLLYTVVITTIAQFNIYGQPLMLTGGGPSNSTRVLLMYIQQDAFGNGQSIAGTASAMAVILGLCIMIVSAVQFFFLRNRN